MTCSLAAPCIGLWFQHAIVGLENPRSIPTTRSMSATTTHLVQRAGGMRQQFVTSRTTRKPKGPVKSPQAALTFCAHGHFVRGAAFAPSSHTCPAAHNSASSKSTPQTATSTTCQLAMRGQKSAQAFLTSQRNSHVAKATHLTAREIVKFAAESAIERTLWPIILCVVGTRIISIVADKSQKVSTTSPYMHTSSV